MQSGKLRRRVVIERRARTQDDHGELVDDWVHHATVWAEVVDNNGREIIRGGTVVATVSTEFTIRYRGGITADMRIRDRGRTWEIVAPPIDQNGRGTELVIVGSEITP